jgi:muramidase (phage lysozyme)
LLTECKALPAIQDGRIEDAIARAGSIWASLPGAGYRQREHALARLLEVYAEERVAEQRPESELLAMFCACGGEMAA